MNLDERLDSFPEAWKPAVGDKLIGTILELDSLESKFGGSYPLVVVQTDAGAEICFHAFHTVAKSELGRLHPKVGERIGIAYFGRDDKVDYERYRVIVERTENNEETMDWEKIENEARSELDDVDTPALGDADAPPEDVEVTL